MERFIFRKPQAHSPLKIFLWPADNFFLAHSLKKCSLANGEYAIFYIILSMQESFFFCAMHLIRKYFIRKYLIRKNTFFD